MELLFFIVFVVSVSYLIMRLFCENELYTLFLCTPLATACYLVLVVLSFLIPIHYELVTIEYEMYPIYENGGVTESYYKLLDRGNVKIDIGESLTINPDKIIYGSEYRLEEIEYTWDDNDVPYSLFPTSGRHNSYILYLKENE